MKHFNPAGFLAAILTAAVMLAMPFVPECRAQNAKQLETKALTALRGEFGDQVKIKFNKATNKASFVRIGSDAAGRLTERKAAGALPADEAADFFKTRGALFGVRDFDRELSQLKPIRDELGETHLSFAQTYKGVPVFGAILRTHFNQAGELRSVNGLFVPDIDLNPTPAMKSDRASATALTKVSELNKDAKGLRVQRVDLLIYRKGLLQGVSGKNHLAYRVEVGNGDVREFVFVDAHNGKIVEQITGKHKAMDRRLFNGNGVEAFPPASFPSSPFWVEGNAFPTGNPLADEILSSSRETYDLYKNAFGRDSYDGLGGPMNSSFNFGFFGNAFATHLFDESTSTWIAMTAYGDDTIADDIVAHEWTHIYTAYTDGLIYAWQPGAVNESYSDIFGEIVDLLNTRGLDSPGANRAANGEYCSFSSKPLPEVRIEPPSTTAGRYDAGYTYLGPDVPDAGVTGQVVRVNDGVGDPGDACTGPIVNADEINGKIALIDVSLSDCFAVDAAGNAEAAGAIAVIMANPPELGDSKVAWASNDETRIGIPSVIIGHTLGSTIKSQLAGGLTVTLFKDPARNSDVSYRWLLAEETSFEGVRDAIRDMYRPNCYMNPGKTSDDEYLCFPFDSGGVHWNSGVPNHTFSLLVDGGIYNGRTIEPLGLTKAAHIYYRAKTVYQHPYTDFADHAEALEAAADDLKSKNLRDLQTGLPSGIKIKNADLNTVHKATLATELRDPPAQCGFSRVVGNNPPDDSCNAPNTRRRTLFSENFEHNPSNRWSVSRDVEDETNFVGQDWTWTDDLPDRRDGSGFFALNAAARCDLPYPSQNSVLHLTGPEIAIPGGLASGPHVSFDHWVALEEGYDGGQVMVSVNGGPFQLVEQSAFIYSGYNNNLLGFDFSSNPRNGQRAFTGVDGGSLDGSWGTSIIDLSGYAQSGDTVRLRFDMSSDYCFGTGLGWYIDNVKVYACDRNRH